MSQSQLPGLPVPDEWAEYLAEEPETGMGYWVVSVTLRGGQRFDRVVITCGRITEVYGAAGVPFDPADIVDMQVTHEKWKFSS